MSEESIYDDEMLDAAYSEEGAPSELEVSTTEEVADEKVESPAKTEGETVEQTTEEETTASESEETEEWTKTAVLDERKKRQAIEAEHKESRNQIQALQQQLQQQTSEFAAFQEQFQKQQLEQQMQGMTPEQRQEFQMQMQAEQLHAQQEQRLQGQEVLIAQMNMQMQETQMRSQHADFDEAVEVFEQAATASPVLLAQLRESQNPAQFAYEQGLQLKQFQDMQSGAYEKRIRDQVMEELNVKPNPPETLPTLSNIPGSSAGVPVTTGAPRNDFDEIYGD